MNTGLARQTSALRQRLSLRLRGLQSRHRTWHPALLVRQPASPGSRRGGFAARALGRQRAQTCISSLQLGSSLGSSLCHLFLCCCRLLVSQEKRPWPALGSTVKLLAEKQPQRTWWYWSNPSFEVCQPCGSSSCSKQQGDRTISQGYILLPLHSVGSCPTRSPQESTSNQAAQCVAARSSPSDQCICKRVVTSLWNTAARQLMLENDTPVFKVLLMAGHQLLDLQYQLNLS